MSDRTPAEALAGALHETELCQHGPHTGDVRPAADEHDDVDAGPVLAALTASGYSLVPTADVERWQRIETAVRAFLDDGIAWPMHGKTDKLAALRAALVEGRK